MYLYHGTTVEKALKILESREVKGKKASRKHKNRYVSLSESLLEARQFGEVIFQFTHVEQAMPVLYKDKDWASTHSEVMEYALANSIHSFNDNEAIHHLDRERKFVVVNKHRFQHEDVTVYLIGKDMKELNKLKRLLDSVLQSGDTVKKSVKLYKDFTENL